MSRCKKVMQKKTNKLVITMVLLGANNGNSKPKRLKWILNVIFSKFCLPVYVAVFLTIVSFLREMLCI